MQPISACNGVLPKKGAVRLPLFPDSWMSDLLAKNDIVSLASEYVSLSVKGGRMWGCCPFHNEKTASFSVTQDKQLFYCFGCHEGGGIIQFVMKIERLEYVDAVKFLAQRVGMELPDEVDDEKLRQDRVYKERLYAACKDAAKIFHTQLMGDSGVQAQQYLLKRGVSGKVVKRFGLGYALDSWDALTTRLMAMGYSENELVDAGLAIRNKTKNSIYDTFRNRVIFPIIATNGRVIAFGARAMAANEEPKYINTGDTPVYNKRMNLYALNYMRGKNMEDLIMVEGYMDVISLHAQGIDNAVASLGTALTKHQARLLKRYVGTVYICYDGDAAGQNATLRGLDILASEGLSVRVMVVPDKLDPDDYVKKFGRDDFLTLKDKALALNGFKLSHMANAYDLSNADGREAFAKEACAFLSTLQPVEKERYAAFVARNSGLSQETVLAQSGLAQGVDKNSIGKKRYSRSSERRSGSEDKPERWESVMMLGILSSRDDAVYTVNRMVQEGVEFVSAGLNAFSEAMMLAYLSDEKPDAGLILSSLAEAHAEVAAATMMQDRPPGEIRTSVDEWLKRIKRELLMAKKMRLSEDYALNTEDAVLRDELREVEAELRKYL